jgi:hypothetical protein
VLTSVGFWVCLLVAAIGYAAATLSSSYVEHQRLAARLAVADAEVRQLAEQVGRYERYCEQLTRPTKPAHSTEGATHAMSLDGALQFRLDDAGTPEAPIQTASAVLPVILAINGSSGVRRLVMLMAAVLLVLAFTLLQESRLPVPACDHHVPKQSVPRRLRGLTTRYRTTTE